MSTAVVERPAAYCFSKNEIRYKFFSNDLTPTNLYLEVRLYARLYNTGSYLLVKTFNLKPGLDGYTYLPVDGYINSLVQFVMPSLTTTFTNASAQAAQFYIHFRQVSAAVPNPDWVTTEEGKVRIALKGGIEKQKASRNNFFLYQEANKSWFSWEPGSRFVFKNQPGFISALIKTPGSYKLKIEVKKVDGTTATQTTTVDLSGGIFFHFNISFSALGIDTIAGGAMVHYYEISLLTSDDSVLYAAVRLYIEYQPVYESFDLFYHNSLGGVGTARVKGETTIGFEKDVQESDGGFSNSGWQDTVKVGESNHFTTKRDTYKGDIGFFASKAHQDAMQDLLISPSIYQFIDGRFVPILNLQKTVAIRKTTDKIFSLPIEWQLPFSNEVFTPQRVELGLGTDTETY